MSLIRVPTTPAPFRNPDPSRREHLREAFDKEFWDDFLAQVFTFEDTSFPTLTQGQTADYVATVPCRVACQLQIAVSVAFSVTVGATASDITYTVIVDGNPAAGTSSARPPVRWHSSVAGTFQDTCSFDVAVPVAAGIHTAGVRVKNNAAVGGPSIQLLHQHVTVRRCKKPPP